MVCVATLKRGLPPNDMKQFLFHRRRFWREKFVAEELVYIGSNFRRIEYHLRCAG
jgi:hypothetical protein